MRFKGLLSFIIALSVILGALTACSDYDNGFQQEELQYITDFKNFYGPLDEQQDWNLAQRSYVVVSTTTPSEIKVYALVNDTYCIVGDYKDVENSQTLYFDMLEGVESILVSDGRTVFKTVPGGIVTFTAAQATRTVYGGNGYVNIEKITNPNGKDIDGVNYPMYKYATDTDITAMKQIVPEIGHRETYTNLNKVTHDFTYMSTGKFVIYPYYWQTSSNNTVGVYYTDASGVRQYVDIYTIKAGSELMYENITDESPSTLYNEEADMDGWSIDNGAGSDNFHRNTWSVENDMSGMKTPFIEYWRGTGNNLLNGTISKTYTGLEPGSYTVMMDVRLFNEGQTATPSGVVAFANATTLDFCSEGNTGTYKEYDGEGNVTKTSAEVYYINLAMNCTVETDGQLTIGFNLNNVTGDWLAFKNVRIIKRGVWKSTDGSNSFGNVIKGQGIVVDIPAGTQFGMYLKAKTDQTDCIFYSESELNTPSTTYGYGVRDDGQGNVTLDENLNPCHASTFHVGGQMFLGFEDWPNNANASDFDLNDLVLAFDGCTPTIINEDPEPAATWLVACEDLGGSFDTDYNDVVFKVEHVSGRETATLTPLAAGGTLASYIFFEDPTTNANEICFGEIHQLFGVKPEKSGSYSPINVGSSRGSAGSSITFPVGADWTMAHYVADNFNQASQYSKNGKECNMGGFAIYVLPDGVDPLEGTIYSTNGAFGDASVVAAPDLGNVPEMICLPYTYELGAYTYVWAWPREKCTIADGEGLGAYPKFADWVRDHSKETDWYKYPYANTVSELKWRTSTEEEVEPEPEPDPDPVVKTTPTIGGVPSINWVSTGTTITGDHNFIVPKNQTLWMMIQLDGTDYSGTGTFTATISDGSKGSASIWEKNNKNELAVTAGSTYGTFKVTLNFSGDANYNATSVTYIIQIPEQVHFKTHANATDYGLAIVSDKLAAIAPYNTGDANQTWYKVNPINDKGQNAEEGTFWLYNVGTEQYVTFDNNDMALALTTSMPIGAKSARFHYDENGWIWESRHPLYYFGLNGFIDGGCTVGLLRTDNGGDTDKNIMSFTIE